MPQLLWAHVCKLPCCIERTLFLHSYPLPCFLDSFSSSSRQISEPLEEEAQQLTGATIAPVGESWQAGHYYSSRGSQPCRTDDGFSQLVTSTAPSNSMENNQQDWSFRVSISLICYHFLWLKSIVSSARGSCWQDLEGSIGKPSGRSKESIFHRMTVHTFLSPSWFLSVFPMSLVEIVPVV